MAFTCFFATDDAAWNKPVLLSKFGNAPVFKLSLTVKKSIGLMGQEFAVDQPESLSFTLLPHVEEGLNKENANPAYICLFKPRFVPPGFRQKLQSLIAVAHSGTFECEIRGKDYLTGSQLFIRILNEQTSGYLYKYDLIRTYLAQVVHLALKRS